MIKGFKEPLLKNKLALAVAVIAGGAVGKVVSPLAADLIQEVPAPSAAPTKGCPRCKAVIAIDASKYKACATGMVAEFHG